MRREALFLADIVEAADAIARSLDDRTYDDFLADDDVRASTLYRLVVIGEAARMLPPVLKDRYPALPWHSIVGFRNRAVHAYFGMDWEIVWDTATAAIPVLRQQVAAIIAEHASNPEAPADPPEDV